MLTNPCAVIVKAGESDCAVVGTKQLHHHHFPEIRVEAGSIAEGLAHLSNQLSRALDGVGSSYHRALIEEALGDVAEFLESLDNAEQDDETLARFRA